MYPVVTADACQPDGCFETNASDLVVCLHGQTFLLLHPVGKHLVAARPPPPCQSEPWVQGLHTGPPVPRGTGQQSKKSERQHWLVTSVKRGGPL